MPIFRKGFFISLHAESNNLSDDWETRKSYYVQRDKNLDRKYSIDMFTGNRRKSLFNSLIPFVRINFPYTNSPDYDITKGKRNSTVADDMIKGALGDTEQFSIIYLNAHCNSQSDSLIQKVYFPGESILDDGDKKTCRIQYTKIADILNKSIPDHAKNNLQIRLLACEATRFAELLMKKLDQLGFKNTSVIYYTESLIQEKGSKINKNTFKLPDLFGAKGADKQTKSVWHNYNDDVQQTDYKTFKKDILKGNERVSSIPGISYQKEEVILFKDVLINNLFKFIDLNEKRNSKQTRQLINTLLSTLDTKSIIDKPDGELDELISNSLRTIKQFIVNINPKDKDISDKNSVIKYLLDGISQFYELQSYMPHSDKLLQLRNHLLQFDNSSSPSSLFLDFESEDSRQSAIQQLNSFDA
ncbi:hypothetical protein L3V86_08210 [Thiotrichales bacterium 19S11-10]|nr:hypothetical protein [Thiotrichales bacterium 19S11-10]